MISKKGTPEQFIMELNEQIDRLTSYSSVESGSALYSNDSKDIKDVVRDGYMRKGFDVTDPSVRELMADTVEYLSHAPDNYTFEDWYVDTMADYPEFFESVTAASSGIVDFSDLPEEQDESDMEDVGITSKRDIDKLDLIDWLSEHDQAYSDICDAFGINDLEDLDYDQIVDWISDHDRLMEDCMNHFGSDVFTATSTSNIIVAQTELDDDFMWELTRSVEEEVIGRHSIVDDVSTDYDENSLYTTVVLETGDILEFTMPLEQLTLTELNDDTDVVCDDIDIELDDYELEL